MSTATVEIERTTIRDYLRCGYPSVAMVSHEEGRLLADLHGLRSLKGFEGLTILTISATQRLIDVTNPAAWKVVAENTNFPKAFSYVAERKDVLLLTFDFQHIISNAPAYRALKDQFPALKQKGSCVILAAPRWKLPGELVHEIPVLDFPLPVRNQLSSALDLVLASSKVGKLSDTDRAECLDAASGLTLSEAENAFSLSVAKSKRLVPALISDEKMKLISSSGLLTIEPPPQVEPGGMGALKEWVRRQLLPHKNNPLLRPKGLLLVGIPGTGKTLVGTAIGAMLNWPVLSCDVGTLKGGVVGESEGNMAAALKLVEATAPNVLLLDEIEKGVGGHQSSAQSDGGTTLGMVGILLKWLQKQRSTVVIATCNDYHLLPPPLTRPGRFAQRFFFDLPDAGEREEIAQIHLNVYSAVQDPGLAIEVARVSEGWTGAEIEELVLSAARLTNQQITKDAVAAASREIRPMSEGEDIQKMREWMKKSFKRANTPELVEVGAKARKMRD